jgi:hypothetical protein
MVLGAEMRAFHAKATAFAELLHVFPSVAASLKMVTARPLTVVSERGLR